MFAVGFIAFLVTAFQITQIQKIGPAGQQGLPGPIGPQGAQGVIGPAGPPGAGIDAKAIDDRIADLSGQIAAIARNSQTLSHLGLWQVCLQRLPLETSTLEPLIDGAEKEAVNPEQYNSFGHPPLQAWREAMVALSTTLNLCDQINKFDLLKEPDPIQLETKQDGEPPPGDWDKTRRYRRVAFQSRAARQNSSLLEWRLTQDIQAAGDDLAKQMAKPLQ
jgi:hypothetical protein